MSILLRQPATEALAALPPALRIVAILGLALLLHLLVRGLRRAGEWIVTPDSSPDLARELFARRRPKAATLTTLLVSAATFAIYFIAIGLVLAEIRVNLTAYFASATVIALAVGFGSQGLVQDVVIGITLVFSDAFDVGDIIEVSGQVGRVDRIGLRFTTLTNFIGQTVYVPNRNIALIGRYRRGAVRAWVDIQLPSNVPPQDVIDAVTRLARGLRAQHRAILLSEPEVLGPMTSEPGGWSYIRVKFRIWPGQQTFMESAFRPRVLARLKEMDPGYADWMVSVAYRTADPG